MPKLPHIAALLRTVLVPILLLLSAPPLPAADRTDDVMETVNYVAASLASGQGTDAATPFDKSTPGYDKLAAYFEALTDQSRVHSDIEVIDETGSETESSLTLRWTLEIRAQVTGDLVERRVQEVHIRFVPAKSKQFHWKIVRFDPVEFFNPVVGEGR